MIRHLIIALILLPIASAAIGISYDAVCNGPCQTDIESDVHDRGQTRISGDGPIAASQAIFWSTDRYNSTSLVDADQGGFQARTPNVNLRAKAEGLKVSSLLEYNTEFFPGAPEVYEDDEGQSWISITNRTLHRQAARFKLSGNGSLDEEVIIAAGGKSRKLFDASMDGNFSLNQALSFSGEELKTSFEMLPKENEMSEAAAEEIVRRGLQDVTR